MERDEASMANRTTENATRYLFGGHSSGLLVSIVGGGGMGERDTRRDRGLGQEKVKERDTETWVLWK